MSHAYRYHGSYTNPLDAGHRYVKRRPQPPVHRQPIVDAEREHLDLRLLAAAAAIELEVIQRKQRARELQATLVTASPWELARMAAPAIERLGGQEEHGPHTMVMSSHGAPLPPAQRRAGNLSGGQNPKSYPTNTTMPIFAALVKHTGRTFVLFEVPPGRSPDEITNAMVLAAAEEHLDSGDWDTISTEFTPGAVFPVQGDDSAGLPVSRPFGAGQTLHQRAEEIGVSENTLHRWKRSGVDIFDDDAVRAKISKGRNWQPGIKPEFRARP